MLFLVSLLILLIIATLATGAIFWTPIYPWGYPYYTTSFVPAYVYEDDWY